MKGVYLIVRWGKEGRQISQRNEKSDKFNWKEQRDKKWNGRKKDGKTVMEEGKITNKFVGQLK